MARSRPSILKRNRERKRQEKRQEKAAKRAERRDSPEDGGSPVDPTEDPDIAGIIPGPQPLPWDDQLPSDET